MTRNRTRLALACITSLALAGAAAAQSDAPTPTQQRELDAARAELDQAAKHFAELARKYHAPGAIPMAMAFDQRVVRKPVLGVLLAPDAQAGVRIAGVTPDSAAASAGLKSGDRLVSVDGDAIAGNDGEARLASLRSRLEQLDDKRPVRLGYVRDGREATTSLTPRMADNIFVWNTGDTPMAMGEGMPALAGIAPDIHREVIRLGDGEAPVALDQARFLRAPMFAPGCKGGDKASCLQPPILFDAFRWNGLNLASLDAKLGSYFGTDAGVLVLSPGPQLPELQAGDVIRSIDGKAVATPREAMDALRARKQGDKATLGLLRDHRDATAQVTVPKAVPLPIPPAPPAPPAPPPPPPTPGMADLPAPPAPPAAPRVVERRHVVVVDDNGKTTEWDDNGMPPPPAPPAPPSPDAPMPPAPPAPPPPPPPSN